MYTLQRFKSKLLVKSLTCNLGITLGRPTGSSDFMSKRGR